MYRTIIASSYRTSIVVVSRSFSTSSVAHKTATEKVSEVADKVNKSLGKGLASAIDTGEQATKKTRETILGVKDEAAKKANKVSDAIGEKANETRAEAKVVKDNATRK